MTYVLEKISPDDQEKIITDAESDQNKKQRLVFARTNQEFTQSWAINRKNNCYLLRMPSVMREEAWDTPYLAFFDGCMYRINREGQSGNSVYFDEAMLPEEPTISVLKEEIRAAFAVYGCWGDGPLNERGIAVWAIDPQFTMKKGV